MPRVADTSVLYALFAEDDAHHRRALDDVSDPEPILLPTEILVETIQLIELRAGHARAVQALNDLLALPQVRIAEKVPVEAVRSVFEAGRGRLSFADAFVVQTCRVWAAPPLSYDRAVREAAS